MRIAVISDIHSAAAPFRKALADARAEGFDQLILLGDLFTYGVDPTACRELAIEAIDRDGAFLVGGNHEQLYIDLRDRRSAYIDRLPSWIRESIEWTWQELGGEWPTQLDWIAEWAWGSALFAHANPFGFGDWTYLSDEELLRAAARRLRERGFRYGIFGHLHREKFFRDEQGVEVHVVDSVGQPRSRQGGMPSWTMVESKSDALHVEVRPVEFDPLAHQSAILRAPGLSEETKSMLCRFYQ
ncbi:metallophosphoesterase family protein [Parerythrobacter aurantius]|uniref:metallophosphoesterase family protein n=1 Tax=Parerythrobacter aurantius TaxID=3127706 RepID=UPI003254C05C